MLGPLLERAAELEQDATLKWLGRLTRWIGPMLIVSLGAIIRLVMIGLMTGVSGAGSTVLG